MHPEILRRRSLSEQRRRALLGSAGLRRALLREFGWKDAPVKRDDALLDKLKTVEFAVLVDDVMFAFDGAESWRWVGPPNFVRQRPSGKRGRIDKAYLAKNALPFLATFWTTVLGKKFEGPGRANSRTSTYLFCRIVIEQVARANGMNPVQATVGLDQALRKYQAAQQSSLMP